MAEKKVSVRLSAVGGLQVRAELEGVGDAGARGFGRLGGQLGVIPGAVLGWDMGAALALAHALGIDTLIAVELLPEIEAVMVRKLNEQIGENHG